MLYNVLVNPQKPLQCEKLLGLAGGNTKKRRNKKADKSIGLLQRHSYVR